MKVVVLILGILGSLASVGLGLKWVSDYNQSKSTLAQIEAMSAQLGGIDPVKSGMQQLERTVKAGYAMAILGGIAFIASLLVFKIPKVSGLILLIAAAVPAVLAPISLVFTFLLVIAGLLAFLIKAKPAAAA